MISFDEILEKKIGNGIYQIKSLITVGLAEFYDSIFYVFMSILITILQYTWKLNKSEVATLGSSYLLGFVIGNYICAYLTDYIGRKNTFIVFSALTTLISLYSAFINSFLEIILIRLLFGIIAGTTRPLGYIVISEITVSNKRGRYSFSLTLIYIFGKIYLIILCLIFLDDFTTGNWRGLFLINAFPSFICFILSIFLLRETTRYILNKGKYSLAFDEIEQITLENNNIEINLSLQEKDGLIAWQLKQHCSMKLNKLNQQQKGIFSKSYRKNTLYIWILLILINQQNMSIYFLMPFLFSENNSNFLDMLYLFIFEFIFSWVIYIFIDDSKYGGRSRILIYASCILIITNLLLFFFKNYFLFIGMLLITISTKSLFSILFIICCESYPLQLRSKGASLAQAVGKISSIPSSYILYPLYIIDPYLPFLILGFIAIIMLILAITFPNDRTQKHLEEISNTSSFE